MINYIRQCCCVLERPSTDLEDDTANIQRPVYIRYLYIGCSIISCLIITTLMTYPIGIVSQFMIKKSVNFSISTNLYVGTISLFIPIASLIFLSMILVIIALIIKILFIAILSCVNKIDYTAIT